VLLHMIQLIETREITPYGCIRTRRGEGPAQLDRCDSEQDRKQQQKAGRN
jgi:hypothetical protein